MSTPAFHVASAGVAAEPGHGVGQARAVQVHPEAPRAGDLDDRAHLRERVHRARLRALGDADRARRHLGRARQRRVDHPRQFGRRHLPVGARHRDRARVASGPELGPAALVVVDVGGVGHVHGAVGRRDDRRAEAVGGRPRADREDLDLRLEQRSEARLESLGGRIGAVRRGVTGVGGDQGGEDLGRGARHVVAVEVLLRAHSGLLGSAVRSHDDLRMVVAYRASE